MARQLERVGECVCTIMSIQSILDLLFMSLGVAMATALVNAGLTTFQKVADRHPRELELVRKQVIRSRDP